MDALVRKAIKRYEDVSFKYFGYVPRFTENKGIIGILTAKREFTVDYEALEDLTDFYAERISSKLTPIDTISEAEIEKLEQIVLPKREGKGAISVILNIPKRAWERRKKRPLLQFFKEEIEPNLLCKRTYLEWQGVIKDIREWAYDLDIATDQLLGRLKTFGKVDLVFMSKEDYKKNVFKYKKLDGTGHVKTVDAGNNLWKELTHKDREFHRKFIPKDKTLKLIEGLILDAKENVMDRKKNPYRDDSISFLMNNNDDLLKLVEVIDSCDTRHVLAKMRLFCIPYLNEKERKKYGISDVEFTRCRDAFARTIPRTNVRKRNGKRKVQRTCEDMAPGCIQIIQPISSIPACNSAVQQSIN